MTPSLQRTMRLLRPVSSATLSTPPSRSMSSSCGTVAAAHQVLQRAWPRTASCAGQRRYQDSCRQALSGGPDGETHQVSPPNRQDNGTAAHKGVLGQLQIPRPAQQTRLLPLTVRQAVLDQLCCNLACGT